MNGENEITTKLPEITPPEERDRQELEQYWLDPSKDYPEPHYILTYKGVGFSPLGEIQALSGQKKNGKTFVMVQLMAAILGEKSDRAKKKLSGLRVNEDTLKFLRKIKGDENYMPSVLYVDTEMGQLNSAKVLRRVHWLCGWDMKQSNARFHVLWLRGVEKRGNHSANDERRRLTFNAIDALKPDAVFIDGIRDIVNDFNDNKESAELISELMRISKENKCCIWNVLHMNPRPQNDDESKMRGHLGTELGNKVSDTFISQKHKDAATGRVTFTVKQQDARGKDVDDWKFEVSGDVGGLGIPTIINQGDDYEKIEKTDSILKSLTWPRTGLTYTEISNALKLSHRKTDDVINIGVENKIITKSGKQYFYVGIGNRVPNDDPEDIPFEQPKADEDMPF